jgi:hypothetical protein
MEIVKKLRRMSSSIDYKLIKESVNEGMDDLLSKMKKVSVLKRFIGDESEVEYKDIPLQIFKKLFGDPKKIKVKPPGAIDVKSGKVTIYAESVNEAIEMSKGVQKLMKIATGGYGKVGGTTVDSMSANLFKQVYNKASDDIKQKINKMNEKQLVNVLHGMWKKFGKNVKL